jgi:hypothetical protein
MEKGQQKLIGSNASAVERNQANHSKPLPGHARRGCHPFRDETLQTENILPAGIDFDEFFWDFEVLGWPGVIRVLGRTVCSEEH